MLVWLKKLDYAAKQAHVELAERMKKRDAGEVMIPTEVGIR